jgi:hypothetical protein
VAQRKTLTEKQIELLRWIAEGCPSGVYEDTFHRISAAALQTRGLIEVSGRGRSWEAKLTGAGEEYLNEVDGPEPPIPRQANVSVTQQLVDDVIAGGGSLIVPAKSWHDPDAVDYERRARLAELHRKVPAGKRLALTDLPDQELRIELIDAPDDARDFEPPQPIEIPEKIARYHPAARQFRDLRERHEVSREHLARATRIIHVIAKECERRGWNSAAPPDSANAYGRTTWTPRKNGHLQIKTDDETFWLRLREEHVHTRGPWEEEVNRYRGVDRDSPWYRDRELPSGPFDADGDGRLTLELFASRIWAYRGRRSRWGDRTRWSLDDRLPDLLREIEDRSAEAKREEEEKRVAAEEAKRVAEEQAAQRARLARPHRACPRALGRVTKGRSPARPGQCLE